MSQIMTIELPDKVFAAVQQAAKRAGTTPGAIVVDRFTLEFKGKLDDPRTPEQLEEARRRFRSFCGAFDSGDPNSADNEQIDADLAREYGDTYEA